MDTPDDPGADRQSPPDAWSLNQALASHGIRVLVLRGGVTPEGAGRSAGQSIQLMVPPGQAVKAAHAADALDWRYSWVREGLLRLLPKTYYWWDGGTELDLQWGCPAAPLPASALKGVTHALWDGAALDDQGLLRPHPAALLVHYAVQACRPARGHQRDWETFLQLRDAITDLAAAMEVARRARVSRALERALEAADAGRGSPGPGPVHDGAWATGWQLASAIQARAPGRIGRLLAGMPSLGDAAIRCRFRGVEVIAGAGVFVPTPDADILVDMAIEILGQRRNPVVVELGTGCGAIALAVAAARPDAEVHATDLSARAIRWAGDSARRAGLERTRFHTGPLLEPVPADLHDRVDLIVANLPFYPARDVASIGSVPRDTIQGEDEDGLGLLRQLARQAPGFLRPGGTLVLQMFSWQWELLSNELTELGYATSDPRMTGPFAICRAEWVGPDGRTVRRG